MRLESHGFGGKVRFAWLNSQHSLSLSSSCHWRVQKEVLLISPLHTGKFQPVTKPLSMFEAIKALFFPPWCDNKWTLYLLSVDQTWPSEAG